MTVSRRGAIAGGAAALVAVLAASRFTHIFGRWYPPSPYDDLLHQIVEREPAAALGKAVLAAGPGGLGIQALDSKTLAARLRQPGFALGRRARGDAAAGRVAGVGGWIVPQSVALYAALAARAN